jgi:dihydroceramidase
LLSIAFRIYYLLTLSDVGKRVPADKKKTIATLFGSGVAQFVFAFLLWNLDNIFCDTVTQWKVSLGWPLAFLLEGHSWWHIVSADYSGFRSLSDVHYLVHCKNLYPSYYSFIVLTGFTGQWNVLQGYRYPMYVPFVVLIQL